MVIEMTMMMIMKKTRKDEHHVIMVIMTMMVMTPMMTMTMMMMMKMMTMTIVMVMMTTITTTTMTMMMTMINSSFSSTFANCRIRGSKEPLEHLKTDDCHHENGQEPKSPFPQRNAPLVWVLFVPSHGFLVKFSK